MRGFPEDAAGWEDGEDGLDDDAGGGEEEVPGVVLGVEGLAVYLYLLSIDWM